MMSCTQGRRFMSLKRLIPALVVVVLITALSPGIGAYGADAAPKGYVGLFKDNAVAVFDTATNRVLGTIPVPPGPEGVLITPNGRRVYVASSGASTVSVIDTATDKLVAYMEVGKDPQGMAVTPDGKYVLVCVSGTDQVAKIDTVKNDVVGTARVLAPHNLAISPDGRTAYVGSQAPNSPALESLDISSMVITGRVTLDKVPRALRFSQSGKLLYFTVAGSEAIQILDPAARRVVGEIPLGFSPHAVAFTPDDSAVLVVVQGPAQLAIIDPATRSVIAKVPVGTFPHWVAVSGDGRTAWVTNENSNDVSVVDLTTKKVTTTFPIGNGPRKVAVQRAAATQRKGRPAADPSVRIKDFAYEPATIAIKPGQTITWTNDDSIPHTVTSDDGKWASGELAQGKSFTHTFTQAGLHTYHCTVHPYMKGTVVARK